MRPVEEQIDALQVVLAAEHAAMFVLSAVGGRTSSVQQPTTYAAISAAWVAHRERRDQLTSRIVELGGAPRPAAAAYTVASGEPAEVAKDVEVRCASVYAEAVAATSGDDRRWAVTALDDAAVRQLALGGRPADFPGLAELADR